MKTMETLKATNILYLFIILKFILIGFVVFVFIFTKAMLLLSIMYSQTILILKLFVSRVSDIC